MNRSLGVHNQFQPGTIENTHNSLPGVLNLLRLVQADTKVASHFSRDFETCEFQLGHELINYSIAASLGYSVQYEHKKCGLYVVTQGRVRLLGFDANQQRQVSTLVLEASEVFGADNVFCNETLPYRAIAASAGQVAWISIAKLKPWLEQMPNLRDYLRQQATRRQCLIFFKTSTELRSLPSYQLQQLLPYVMETRIKSGELLVQASPPGSGRFWLRSGLIQSKLGEFPPPVAGQSWGYSDLTVADWIAHSDLVVYHLPKEHWQAAQAVVPILGAVYPQTESVKDKTSGNGHRRHEALRVAPPQSPPAQHSGKRRLQPQTASTLPQSDFNTPQEQPESVVFPQPVKQRRLGRKFWQGYPFIEQQSSSDYDLTCLAMIGCYWGKQFGINSLRNLAEVGRAGSLKRLAITAEKLGFHAKPVRASLSRLADQTNPWIAHWQGEHFVVVYRVKGNRVLVADPAVGRRWLSQRDFQAGWSGYALLLEPTAVLEAAKTEKSSLGRFWGLWSHRSVLLQIILASVLLQLFGLVTPFFTQVILDRVVVNKSLITLHVFSVGLLLFGVWRIGLVAIRQYLLDYFSNRLDLTLISGFISHTLKFFESRHVGDIITRVQENQFQEVVISVERLDDVFSAQPEESPQNPLLVLPRLRGDVRFENVTFRYDEDEERNTLQNISFKVRSGQIVAIVGRSGSGKSTLVSMLEGLYHPNKGRIWMDEHDIRHASPQSLRSQLGVVPQECFLFSGTILENITLYRPEFTLEQVIEVAKLAEAHAFIQDLPLGYNTKVGERGSTLSGGQRQRIAIARALLGEPRILILDEATSSLDTESERRFQQNLARISRDRTTFVIAHRLSTIRNADYILVLDKGIVVERGSHDELMVDRGLYYHLAQQQIAL